MKKLFFIFLLLVAFNFSVPNTQALNDKLRHKIEYTQEKERNVTNEELLKNKVSLELRKLILIDRVCCVNYYFALSYNTS